MSYHGDWSIETMKAGLRVRNRVKLARVERGYTQQELADLIGVTRQTIGLIEAEKYNPTITLCLRLAQVLHKSLTDLFWGEELA
jgi:putative transcriptional regulator